MTCLACGRVGHRAAHCPSRTEGAKFEDESAPFVCYADQNNRQESFHTSDNKLAEACSDERMTTAEAMSAGIGIIDGGATKTLASVAALEQLMLRNKELRGDSGVKEVDVNSRPVFSFGNSSSNKCLSTTHMSITAGGRPGVLKVHTIDEGTGPLLISVETLRSLGAVIDFGEDLAVFRKVSDRHVIKLGRSVTGHQLLPLTQDLLANAEAAKRAVPGLSSFLEPEKAPADK